MATTKLNRPASQSKNAAAETAIIVKPVTDAELREVARKVKAAANKLPILTSERIAAGIGRDPAFRWYVEITAQQFHMRERAYCERTGKTTFADLNAAMTTPICQLSARQQAQLASFHKWEKQHGQA
ncbi:MAG: hypothetical protein QM765_20895 [Myxococcales bacterium]